MPEVPLPSIPEKFNLTPEFRLMAACSWIAPPALEQVQAYCIRPIAVLMNVWICCWGFCGRFFQQYLNQSNIDYASCANWGHS